MNLEPVTLEGRHVRLVPMAREHLPALWEVARDEELWRWTMNTMRTEADLADYVDDEWPAVRARLREMLARPYPTP